MSPKSPLSIANLNRVLKVGCSAVLGLVATLRVVAQDYVYEKPPFDYWSESVKTKVSALEESLAKGEKTLPFQDSKALVEALLKEFNVPVESQVFVFSKTSLQRDRISATTPRVVYFNEDTYIGWVPGGLIEFAQIDPKLGPIFYSLDADRPDRKSSKFDRAETCMTCHAGGMTDNLPGLMSRSVYPNERGEPIFQAGTSLIDQQSPLETRWGGWYVTGNSGSLVHRGNAFAKTEKDTTTLDTRTSSNRKSLDDLFDTSRYLRKTSDIVALLVLDHQVGMHQRFTKASYDMRGTLSRRIDLLKELGEDPGNGMSGSALSVGKSHVDKILEFLLFVDEAPLPDGGVDGDPEFIKAYTSNRKATKDGRSLKDFQLLTRIFKYRCSYLIYSPEWDELPAPLLELLYQKLHEILTSKTPVKGYEHLSESERKSILEILLETKPNLPASWHGNK